jgi:uncharacterized membrane protein
VTNISKRPGLKMNRNTINISIFSIFAALYAIIVIFLAPISFGVYQVRLADALLPLSMIFGIPSALGFGLGALIANIYGTLGIVDIIGGALANFIACSLAYYIAQKNGIICRFIASLIETVSITVIVGWYLSILFSIQIEISLIGILIGSIIAINLIGFPIQEIIRKSQFFKSIIKK